MKRRLLLFLLLIACLPLNAAAQTGWYKLGTGPHALNANNQINVIAADSKGNVYAAGRFTNDSGRWYVAKWDGIRWAELGTGTNALNANSFIWDITIDKAGNVYAAGSFTNAAGSRYVAKWNGITWTQVGMGGNALNANAGIVSLTIDAMGNLYAAGAFTNSTGAVYVSKWNGTTWAELGTGVNALNGKFYISSIITDAKGDVYATGAFRNTNGYTYVAKWNGTNWAELGKSTPINNTASNIYALAIDAAGNIYAAGNLANVSGFGYVAKWDGNVWAELGTGTNALNSCGSINCIASDASGNIYAASNRYVSSNVCYSYVAKWNGTNWAELGAGPNALKNGNGAISSIKTDTFGNVYAAGTFTDSSNFFYVAKYHDTIRSATSIAYLSQGHGNAITVYPNPNMGNFTIACRSCDQYIGKRIAIQLYNLLGQRIYHSEVIPDKNDLYVDIRLDNDVAEGLYHLQLTAPDMTSVSNIVIKR